MGYTTTFQGSFLLDRPLTPAHHAYLAAFANTDHMQRNEELTGQLPDPIRTAVGLSVGPEGAYYVGEHIPDDPSVIDMTSTPWGMPTNICQWVPTEEGTAIRWDGQEKFYDYSGWLEYLIKHFLHRWSYVLNGEIRWQGEDRGGNGFLVIDDNYVHTHPMPLDRNRSLLTTNVVGLAQAIAENGNFDLLPILGDSLEELGCTETDILRHCRNQKIEHSHGCYVVEMITSTQRE